MKVLLIEDNPDHQLLIGDTLTEAIATTGGPVCAGELESGLQQLEDGAFDICLCDLSLPDSPVQDTITRLQAIRSHTPIVVLTSLDDLSTELELIKGGIQDYLPKGDLSPKLLRRICLHAIERKKLYVDIEELTKVDPLTGLKNRRAFEEMFKHHMSLAARHDQPLSLCIIDVDKFKEINDSKGHPVGDKVLTLIAEFLQSCSRESDVLARLGGDEFAMLLPNSDASQARSCALRVQEALRDSVVSASSTLPEVTLSIGVSEFGEGVISMDEMISRADQALYAAKGSGRNTIAMDADAKLG